MIVARINTPSGINAILEDERNARLAPFCTYALLLMSCVFAVYSVEINFAALVCSSSLRQCSLKYEWMGV